MSMTCYNVLTYYMVLDNLQQFLCCPLFCWLFKFCCSSSQYFFTDVYRMNLTPQ